MTGCSLQSAPMKKVPLKAGATIYGIATRASPEQLCHITSTFDEAAHSRPKIKVRLPYSTGEAGFYITTMEKPLDILQGLDRL